MDELIHVSVFINSLALLIGFEIKQSLYDIVLSSNIYFVPSMIDFVVDSKELLELHVQVFVDLLLALERLEELSARVVIRVRLLMNGFEISLSNCLQTIADLSQVALYGSSIVTKHLHVDDLGDLNV